MPARTAPALSLTVGPIVGHTTPTTVRLWGRGEFSLDRQGAPRPCFGVAKLSQPGGPATIKVFPMLPHFDFTGIVDFNGLAPDTAYTFEMGYCFAELPDAAPKKIDLGDCSQGSFRT